MCLEQMVSVVPAKSMRNSSAIQTKRGSNSGTKKTKKKGQLQTFRGWSRALRTVQQVFKVGALNVIPQEHCWSPLGPYLLSVV